MDRAKQNIFIVALERQFYHIKNGDKQMIESFLKRREPRYKDKQEQSFEWVEEVKVTVKTWK